MISSRSETTSLIFSTRLGSKRQFNSTSDLFRNWWWCWEMSTFGMEPILVCCVVDRVLKAVGTSVGIEARRALAFSWKWQKNLKKKRLWIISISLHRCCLSQRMLTKKWLDSSVKDSEVIVQRVYIKSTPLFSEAWAHSVETTFERNRLSQGQEACIVGETSSKGSPLKYGLPTSATVCYSSLDTGFIHSRKNSINYRSAIFFNRKNFFPRSGIEPGTPGV